MQKIRKFVPTVLLACLVHVAFSQDSTFVEEKAEKKIQYTPYYSVEKLKSLGNYVGVMDDSTQFQLSAGISVFNTPRGFIPNVNVNTYGPNASAIDYLLVVDGIPYSQTAAGYYNLNSFDYTSLTFLSRGNAASAYGVYGGEGGIALKTKTGENHFRPTVEFNSYSTLGWSDNVRPIVPSTEHKTYTWWYLSNSLAYMQDFGKVDTRISYNFGHTPSPNTGAHQHSNKHNFKINTGIDITSKFNVRLILDKFFSIAKSGNSSYMSLPSYTASRDRDFMQGNLILKYKLNSWLNLSSQMSLLRINDHTESYNNINDLKTNRFLTNFFVSLDKHITEKFSISSFLGVQHEQTDTYTEINAGSNYQSTETDANAILGGVGFNFGDYFFANLNYRQDMLSVLPANQKDKTTYALSAAFVFSDAFHWNSQFLSSGKVRGSVGKTHTDIDDDNSYFLPVVSKDLTELGIDLSFLKSRVSFTMNYFNELYEKMLTNSIPSTGYIGYLINLGQLRKKGTEIILGVTAVKNTNVNYQIQLLGMRSKFTIENGTTSTSNPGNLLVIDPAPSWTGSLLNRVVYKNIMFSFLVDLRKGGTLIDYSGEIAGPLTGVTYDATQLKLRDLSLAYGFSKSFFNKVGVTRTQLSASARNIALLYSASGQDAESSFMFQKSASLSLNLFF